MSQLFQRKALLVTFGDLVKSDSHASATVRNAYEPTTNKI